MKSFFIFSILFYNVLIPQNIFAQNTKKTPVVTPSNSSQISKLNDIRLVIEQIQKDTFNIALKAQNGLYVSIGGGVLKTDIAATSKDIDWNEILTVVKVKNDTIAIMNEKGYFCSYQSSFLGNFLMFDSQEIGQNNLFQIVYVQPKKIALKTTLNLYLTCVDGKIGLDSSNISANTTFELTGIQADLKLSVKGILDAISSQVDASDLSPNVVNSFQSSRSVISITHSSCVTCTNINKVLSQKLTVNEYKCELRVRN